MAKSKKRTSSGGGRQTTNLQQKKNKKMQTFTRLSTSSSSHQKPSSRGNNNGPLAKQRQKQQHQHRQEFHQRPTIPFRRNDRILLIGEGDFSFARSLAEHHRCHNVYATCYDSGETLFAKYPHARANIDGFLGHRNHPTASENGGGGDDDAGTKNSHRGGNVAEKEEDTTHQSQRKTTSSTRKKVLFSVDARKLASPGAGGGKDIRQGIIIPPPPRRKFKANRQKPLPPPPPSTTLPGGPVGNGPRDGAWDIISFNFPHVGGISTDVNRQVRANQELLVAFFKACVPLLSSSSSSSSSSSISDDGDDSWDSDDDDDEQGKDPDRYNTESDDDDDDDDDDDNDRSMIRTVPRARGQILVTLFEGEPYTLWNIRDLARHANLRVVTSFRFPWRSYPGYSHARTLGVVESRSGKVGGGWKGEDREARTYVFEVKGDDDSKVLPLGKKRAREEDSSDSDG